MLWRQVFGNGFLMRGFIGGHVSSFQFSARSSLISPTRCGLWLVVAVKPSISACSSANSSDLSQFPDENRLQVFARHRIGLVKLKLLLGRGPTHLATGAAMQLG
jgi:hypothetical protein